MSKIPTYEDTVRAVRKKVRVSPFDIAFTMDWRTATRYLTQMEREGIVGPADTLGLRAVLPEHPRPGGNDQPHQADGTCQKSSASNCDVKPPNEKDRIAELEAQVVQLKKAGRTVIAQREEWKARALAAEKQASSATSEASDRSRYGALKRVLARELHPDYAPSDGIERVIREAIFKKLWPQVEDIEKSV